jgi:hypothetical protein
MSTPGAGVLLVEACFSREVRTRDPTSFAAISPLRWADAFIDFETGKVCNSYSTLHKVEINSADLKDWLLRTQQGQKHPGGAPPKYDWEPFFIEIGKIANTPDGLPSREKLMRLMTSWCDQNFKTLPDEKTIRNKVSKACKQLGIT